MLRQNGKESGIAGCAGEKAAMHEGQIFSEGNAHRAMLRRNGKESGIAGCAGEKAVRHEGQICSEGNAHRAMLQWNWNRRL